ncbi:MAG TPA: hypothetical protein VE172_12015 [Stackebrandtia sp.]|jgi:hypothetical protein|uniref:hypothetical protein n=1 Tax=Stackebrandtia sp. TaxID=2023065 RepID=UPI002D2392B3|nr:hypothetical protein [Stackebrandtia sp.]HZE39525.1 hypothetical protein [Stackebrandtia sp.]
MGKYGGTRSSKHGKRQRFRESLRRQGGVWFASVFGEGTRSAVTMTAVSLGWIAGDYVGAIVGVAVGEATKIAYTAWNGSRGPSSFTNVGELRRAVDDTVHLVKTDVDALVSTMKSRLRDALARVIKETQDSGLEEVPEMVSALESGMEACEQALAHSSSAAAQASAWASGA